MQKLCVENLYQILFQTETSQEKSQLIDPAVWELA